MADASTAKVDSTNKVITNLPSPMSTSVISSSKPTTLLATGSSAANPTTGVTISQPSAMSSTKGTTSGPTSSQSPFSSKQTTIKTSYGKDMMTENASTVNQRFITSKQMGTLTSRLVSAWLTSNSFTGENVMATGQEVTPSPSDTLSSNVTAQAKNVTEFISTTDQLVSVNVTGSSASSKSADGSAPPMIEHTILSTIANLSEIRTQFTPVFTTVEQAITSSIPADGNYSTIAEVTTLAAELENPASSISIASPNTDQQGYTMNGKASLEATMTNSVVTEPEFVTSVGNAVTSNGTLTTGMSQMSTESEEEITRIMASDIFVTGFSVTQSNTDSIKDTSTQIGEALLTKDSKTPRTDYIVTIADENTIAQAMLTSSAGEDIFTAKTWPEATTTEEGTSHPYPSTSHVDAISNQSFTSEQSMEVTVPSLTSRLLVIGTEGMTKAMTTFEEKSEFATSKFFGSTIGSNQNSQHTVPGTTDESVTFSSTASSKIASKATPIATGTVQQTGELLGSQSQHPPVQASQTTSVSQGLTKNGPIDTNTPNEITQERATQEITSEILTSGSIVTVQGENSTPSGGMTSETLAMEHISPRNEEFTDITSNMEALIQSTAAQVPHETIPGDAYTPQHSTKEFEGTIPGGFSSDYFHHTTMASYSTSGAPATKVSTDDSYTIEGTLLSKVHTPLPVFLYNATDDNLIHSNPSQTFMTTSEYGGIDTGTEEVKTVDSSTIFPNFPTDSTHDVSSMSYAQTSGLTQQTKASAKVSAGHTTLITNIITTDESKVTTFEERKEDITIIAPAVTSEEMRPMSTLNEAIEVSTGEQHDFSVTTTMMTKIFTELSYENSAASDKKTAYTSTSDGGSHVATTSKNQDDITSDLPSDVSSATISDFQTENSAFTSESQQLGRNGSDVNTNMSTDVYATFDVGRQTTSSILTDTEDSRRLSTVTNEGGPQPFLTDTSTTTVEMKDTRTDGLTNSPLPDVNSQIINQRLQSDATTESESVTSTLAEVESLHTTVTASTGADALDITSYHISANGESTEIITPAPQNPDGSILYQTGMTLITNDGAFPTATPLYTQTRKVKEITLSTRETSTLREGTHYSEKTALNTGFSSTASPSISKLLHKETEATTSQEVSTKDSTDDKTGMIPHEGLTSDFFSPAVEEIGTTVAQKNTSSVGRGSDASTTGPFGGKSVTPSKETSLETQFSETSERETTSNYVNTAIIDSGLVNMTDKGTTSEDGASTQQETSYYTSISVHPSHHREDTIQGGVTTFQNEFRQTTLGVSITREMSSKYDMLSMSANPSSVAAIQSRTKVNGNDISEEVTASSRNGDHTSFFSQTMPEGPVNIVVTEQSTVKSEETIIPTQIPPSSEARDTFTHDLSTISSDISAMSSMIKSEYITPALTSISETSTEDASTEAKSSDFIQTMAVTEAGETTRSVPIASSITEEIELTTPLTDGVSDVGNMHTSSTLMTVPQESTSQVLTSEGSRKINMKTFYGVLSTIVTTADQAFRTSSVGGKSTMTPASISVESGAPVEEDHTVGSMISTQKRTATEDFPDSLTQGPTLSSTTGFKPLYTLETTVQMTEQGSTGLTTQFPVTEGVTGDEYTLSMHTSLSVADGKTSASTEDSLDTVTNVITQDGVIFLASTSVPVQTHGLSSKTATETSAGVPVEVTTKSHFASTEHDIINISSNSVASTQDILNFSTEPRVTVQESEGIISQHSLTQRLFTATLGSLPVSDITADLAITAKSELMNDIAGTPSASSPLGYSTLEPFTSASQDESTTGHLVQETSQETTHEISTSQQLAEKTEQEVETTWSLVTRPGSDIDATQDPLANTTQPTVTMQFMGTTDGHTQSFKPTVVPHLATRASSTEPTRKHRASSQPVVPSTGQQTLSSQQFFPGTHESAISDNITDDSHQTALTTKLPMSLSTTQTFITQDMKTEARPGAETGEMILQSEITAKPVTLVTTRQQSFISREPTVATQTRHPRDTTFSQTTLKGWHRVTTPVSNVSDQQLVLTSQSDTSTDKFVVTTIKPEVTEPTEISAKQSFTTTLSHRGTPQASDVTTRQRGHTTEMTMTTGNQPVVNTTTYPSFFSSGQLVTTSKSHPFTDQLVITTGKSVVTMNLANVTTKEPEAQTESILITTEEPAVMTRQTVVTTKEAVASSSQEVVSTQPPLATAISPMLNTRPTVKTRHPEVNTPPQVTTRDQVYFTSQPSTPKTGQPARTATAATHLTTGGSLQHGMTHTQPQSSSTAALHTPTQVYFRTTPAFVTQPTIVSTDNTTTADGLLKYTSQQTMRTMARTTLEEAQYAEVLTATVTILKINGIETFVSMEMRNQSSHTFFNFQAQLCNALLEYFVSLPINTVGIICRVTSLVNGSIIASLEFNVTAGTQDDALNRATQIYNAQITSNTVITDPVSRNEFTLATFTVNGRDICRTQAPCQNGATCIDLGFDSHRCMCWDQYTGPNCEEALLLVLNVVSKTDTTATLAWKYPENLGNIDAFFFEIRVSGEEEQWIRTQLISEVVHQFTITDLQPDTFYFIRLLAVFSGLFDPSVISFQVAFQTMEASVMPEKGADVQASVSYSTLIWILIIIAIMAFILFLFVVMMAYRRRDSVRLPFKGDNKGRFEACIRDNVAYDFESQLAMPASARSTSHMALTLEEEKANSPAYWEIPLDKLVVGKRKQYGKFGETFFGKVLIGNQSLSVDVKKKPAPSERKKIMAELAVLGRLGHHSNILNLVGASTKLNTVYLVYEAMEPVQLDVFVQTIHDVHKPVKLHVPDFDVTMPLMPLLMQFAIDIASGLSYLSSKGVVHHSLGVRNIALTTDLVAKVTDFKVHRQMLTGRHSTYGHRSELEEGVTGNSPSTKWMAYESLVFNTYTDKSNVWSLGVMIWEIMSFGREPFEGFSDDDLARRLMEGYTLNQPDGCLDDVYEMIQSCLRLEAKERPTLRSFHARLVRRKQCIKLQDNNTRAKVFQSLAQLSDNHDSMSPPQVRSMEMLVNSNANKELPQDRLMAVQYAATAFPGNHVASKYMLLSACGDENEVVRTEATNIIKMQARIGEMDIESEMPTHKALPSFPQMISYVRQKAIDNLPNSSQKSQGPLGVFTIPFKALVYEKVAVFLRMCLAYSAGTSPNAFKTAEMMQQGPIMNTYVNDLIERYAGDPCGPVLTYMGLLRQYVSAIGDGRGLYSLLELVAMAPEKLAQQFVKKVDSLKMLLHSDDEAVRFYAGQLMAVVLCYTPPSVVIDTITQLTMKLDTESTEISQAMIWALGYIIGRQIQKEVLANKDTFTKLTDTQNMMEGNVYRRATEAIVVKLESDDPTIVKAACTAVAEIGRSGPIPLSKGGKNNSKGSPKSSVDSVESRNGTSSATKLSVVQRLGEILNADSMPFLEVKKEASLALAHLTVGEAEFPYRKLVIDALCNSVRVSAPIKEEFLPYHFYLADSLATALQGPMAPVAVDPWHQSTMPQNHSIPVTTDVKVILNSLVTDSRLKGWSEEREAISVRLLVLLETFQDIEPNRSEMMQIVMETVNLWDAQGSITMLQEELQKRILEVLKLCRNSSKTFTPSNISHHVSNEIPDDPLVYDMAAETQDLNSEVTNDNCSNELDLLPSPSSSSDLQEYSECDIITDGNSEFNVMQDDFMNEDNEVTAL
ncbi:uncharacterized protein [Diadema antillarum]|uniref:uncharacterized protein n=1 Tax=Diadema antillarum TaxID=105358 RepID=UPI003A8C4B69